MSTSWPAWTQSKNGGVAALHHSPTCIQLDQPKFHFTLRPCPMSSSGETVNGCLANVTSMRGICFEKSDSAEGMIVLALE